MTPPPISSKAWGTALAIDTVAAGDSDSPQIALNGSGRAIAVWRQYDGFRMNIWASFFNGTSWGAAELIETSDTGDAGAPQVAMNDTGDAIAVWRQYDGSQFSIYANYFNGTDWDTAELIENSTLGNANLPQIAMNEDGKAMVVWQYTVSGNSRILTNYYNGSEWGTPQNIGDDDADSPQVAMNGDGTIFAVWRQLYNFLYDIKTGSFEGASWHAPELIDHDNNGSAYSPQIAMDDDGNAVVVWKQYDGFRYNIWANYFDAGLSTPKWGTAERIESERGTADDPQVAMDNSGNAIAVWAQDDGSDFSIYSSRFDGASWGTAELIESGSAGDAVLPQVAVNDTGDAVAAWVQDDGSNDNIYANRFDGAAWDTAELIESDNAGDADLPQIAMNRNGDAIAVWVQYDGSRFGIYANLFR